MATPFYTLMTKKGLEKLQQAQVTETKAVFTHMAVGDGGGVEIKPDAEQTELVNEVWRGKINSIVQNADDKSQIKVELIIPGNVGGWWIREAGIFDSDGDLCAVSSEPPSYKPKIDEGSGLTQIIMMVIAVDNADSIELKYDDSIALATHEWVLEMIEKFCGGETKDYVTREEGDRFGINGLPMYNIYANDEYLDSLNIPGIYHLSVERSKLGIDSGDYIITVLKAKYLDGQYFISQTAKTWGLVGPGSAPHLSTPVFHRAFLIDHENKPTSKKYWFRFEVAKIGQISFFAHTHAQPGYFYCDGSAFDRKIYYMLYDIIGETFGKGDGSTTFNIPDLRSRFIRGYGPDSLTGAFGSYQADEVGKHRHNLIYDAIEGQLSTKDTKRTKYWRGERFIYMDTEYAGGQETRPKNLCLYPCICYM